MKQKDIALIVVVIFLSGIMSFFVSKTLFASPKDLQSQVEVVEPISAEFKQPDTRYFSKDSINPTKPIIIGDGQNQQPFQQSQN